MGEYGDILFSGVGVRHFEMVFVLTRWDGRVGRCAAQRGRGEAR